MQDQNSNADPTPLIDYTLLNAIELAKYGFMRWGRAPVPDLYLMPTKLFNTCVQFQTLYGIDGKPYTVGVDDISTEDLMGYIAYGVKVDNSEGPCLPENPPETSTLDRASRRHLERQAKKGRGTFLS